MAGACWLFKAGQLPRCTAPGPRPEQACNAELGIGRVGLGTVVRVCYGATDRPGPHTERRCPSCRQLVRVEVLPAETPTPEAANAV